MISPILLTVALLFQCVFALTARPSLINCTWPCPDPNDICIVTSKEANCQPYIENSWIILSPKKAPFYNGASVTVRNAECISAPIPQLPSAQQNQTPPAGYSIIDWPINSTQRRPQDEYLGNCGHLLYCLKSNTTSSSVCVSRLGYDSACESSNQCAHGFCINNVCRPRNDNMHNNGNNSTNNGHSYGRHPSGNSVNRQTVEIIASVLGVVSAILFAGIGIFLYRRHVAARRNNSNILVNNSNANDNTIERVVVEQQFATDFLGEIDDGHQPAATKPTRQQQDLIENSSNENSKPPPYTP